MSFPYRPTVPVKPGQGQAPDWTTSDFSTFERAVDEGRSAGNVTAVAWNGDGKAGKVANDPNAVSRFEDFKRYLQKKNLSPSDVATLGILAGVYRLKHPKDGDVAMQMIYNQTGTITPQQDAIGRNFFEENKHSSAAQKAYKIYNDSLTTGELRIVP